MFIESYSITLITNINKHVQGVYKIRVQGFKDSKNIYSSIQTCR